MAYQAKATLLSDIAFKLPDNFIEDISPEDVRTVCEDICDSFRPLGETQTLTDGATIDWDVSAGAQAFVTLGGNRALNEPTNVQYGQTLVLSIAQDGTGSRTLSWNAFFVFPNDTSPTLSTNPNRVDTYVFQVIDDGGGNKRAIQISETKAVWRSGWTPAPV